MGHFADMNRIYTPCYRCYVRLVEEFVDAAVLWAEFCQDATTPISVMTVDDVRHIHDELLYLERKKYLVTHEVEHPFVIVKVSGMRGDHDCVCLDRH